MFTIEVMFGPKVVCYVTTYAYYGDIIAKGDITKLCLVEKHRPSASWATWPKVGLGRNITLIEIFDFYVTNYATTDGKHSKASVEIEDFYGVTMFTMYVYVSVVNISTNQKWPKDVTMDSPGSTYKLKIRHYVTTYAPVTSFGFFW